MSDVLDKKTGDINYVKPTIVVDNFLPTDLFKHIETCVLSDKNWEITRGVAYKDEDSSIDKGDPRYLQNIQTVNVVYNRDRVQNDFLIDVVQPVLNKLKVVHLIRIKFNITYAVSSQDNDLFYHRDLDEDVYCKGMKIAVLNFTDCDGGTIFKENKAFVQSAANRAIVFNADEEHSGVHCTDERYRLVMNVVYIPRMTEDEKSKGLRE